MAELDSVHNSGVTTERLDLEWANPDLFHLQSLVTHQVERIHDLERALDQSLISLEELRLQLVEQQFLENQLAATEDIANVQQRAITQLKQQITQQKQALETQQNQTQEQSQAFQGLLDIVEGLTEGQPDRLPPLKTQIHDDSTQEPNQLPLITASSTEFQTQPHRERLQELIRHLSGQANVDQLEAELCHARTALQEQQLLITELQQVRSQPQISSASVSEQELFAAHCKIQDLETQISKHHTTHAILQHTCQELEQARDRYQSRATELEQQTAEMQEQILKQAQQASEYETAVQHWKDRCLKNQDYLRRLHDAIERTNPNLDGELADLLIAIQAIVAIPEPESSTALTHRDTKLDLPDFLARRQRYRVRS